MAIDKKIISINRELGRETPKEVLKELLENADDYECIVVMAERKAESRDETDDSYDLRCSDMSIADANYLLDVGKFILFHSDE